MISKPNKMTTPIELFKHTYRNDKPDPLPSPQKHCKSFDKKQNCNLFLQSNPVSQ